MSDLKSDKPERPVSDEVRDYGEPWVVGPVPHDASESWSREVDVGPVEASLYVQLPASEEDRFDGEPEDAETLAYAHHLVACVNAMDGCRPEKLAALLEAVEHIEARGHADRFCGKVCDCGWQEIHDALLAFRPQPKEEAGHA